MKRRTALLGLLAAAALPACAERQANGQEKAAPSPYGFASDADLFAALDLSLPALAPVKAAVDKGDMTGAKKAWADYLRARTSVVWTTPTRVADRSAVTWSREKAENAVNGKIQVVTIWHTFPNGDIDWRFNKTKDDPHLPDNNEWQWQSNRMGWWGDLLRAYQATGEEKYAQAWVKQMRSWAAQNPAPTKQLNGAGSSWRTIESGIRMGGQWPSVFFGFLLSPSFGDDDIATFTKTVLTHCRYLAANSTAGNWLTMEMSGLFTAASLFPEAKEAKGWRKFAADKMYAELTTQFLPDGAQVELTPGYHNVALDNVLRLYSVAKQVGRENELPADYVALTERAFAYNLALMTPDRNLPRFNDSWPYGVEKRMITASELFPKRADFRWVATGGKEGAPPKMASLPLPYAGFYVMRTGWDKNATYAVLDGGPLGFSHVHQDKNNLVVWAYGKEVLFDGGGGSYESSKWRTYATDTPSHNTVLVDNKPQRRQTKDKNANVSKSPINAKWESTADYDFAESVYEDGWGEETAKIASHTRRVLFVKPKDKSGTPFIVVSDTLKPGDTASHTYQARWHVLPTETAMDTKSKTVATAKPGEPNLAVVPLLSAGLEVRAISAQTAGELLGWHIRKDMDPQYVPASTILHTKAGAGEQRFLTVLVPLKAGESNPVQGVRATGAGGEITLTGGRTLTVTESGDGSLSVMERSAGGAGRRIIGGKKRADKKA